MTVLPALAASLKKFPVLPEHAKSPVQALLPVLENHQRGRYR